MKYYKLCKSGIQKVIFNFLNVFVKVFNFLYLKIFFYLIFDNIVQQNIAKVF